MFLKQFVFKLPIIIIVEEYAQNLITITKTTLRIIKNKGVCLKAVMKWFAVIFSYIYLIGRCVYDYVV